MKEEIQDLKVTIDEQKEIYRALMRLLKEGKIQITDDGIISRTGR
jgi:hypothetical protein